MTQLVLNQRGSSLSVKNGRYCVRSKEREFFLPTHEVNEIMLHPATRLTYEAVLTAIEQNTDVLFVDRKGFPVGRIWSHQFGSIATIRKQQLHFSQSVQGLLWVRSVLIRKLDNQLNVLDLLSALYPERFPGLPATEQKFSNYKARLSAVPTDDAAECFAAFRGLEGSAGRLYFQAISTGLPDQYRFQKRAQRAAPDMFNCLLNYAYGMLYGLCESALIRAGLDPFIGIMHRDEYNRPVLVYDFIELFRAWADYVVCHLLLQEIIFEDFFDVDDQTNTYWLNTTGKRILIQSMNDYLAEIVTLNGLTRSRQHHVLLEAQKMAGMLKK